MSSFVQDQLITAVVAMTALLAVTFGCLAIAVAVGGVLFIIAIREKQIWAIGYAFSLCLAIIPFVLTFRVGGY